MGIRGSRFLELNGLAPCEFSISHHALERLARGVCKSEVDLCTALACFLSSSQLTFDEVFQRGYHPNIAKYQLVGVQSWYFSIRLDDCELLAVVERGRFVGARPFWRTTYSPDRSTNNSACAPIRNIKRAEKKLKRNKRVHKSYVRHMKNRKGPRRRKTTDRRKRRERRVKPPLPGRRRGADLE